MRGRSATADTGTVARGRGRSPLVATVAQYGTVGAATAVLAGLVLRLWSGGRSAPVVYRDDTLSALAMFDAAGWTGTARGAPLLGAPHGTDWVDFPLGPDRLHLVALRLLRLVVDDPMAAANLYLVAGFVLVALAAFGVLRHLRVSALIAGALGITFSLAPYHFMRIQSGHVFLAAYYAVPLGVLLALWASNGSLVGPAARHRRWWALAWVLVVGSASAYYAMFTIVLVAGLGLALAVRRGSWRALLVPAVLAASIGAVVVANVAGELVTASARGHNAEAAARPRGDSDWYALRPLSMALPGPDHRLGAAAAVGARYDATVARRGGSYLGLIALAGLVVIAARCLRAGDDADGPLYRRLGVMVGVAVLVASVGGGAVLFAVAGFGQIRVWDRMTVVIGFLGLAGLGPALDRWLTRRWAHRDAATAVVAVALVAVAVLDQVGTILPDRVANEVARSGDAAVAAELQAMLDPGDSVLQFPYVAFPGGVTDRGMPIYAHLGPWAAGDGSLSYSAGGMQGRGGDWQATWLAQEPVVMAAGAAAAGFDALYIDRRADPAPGQQDTARSGAATAEVIEERLDLPSGTSADGTRQWFDLRPVRERLERRWGRDAVAELGRSVTRPIGVIFDGAATYTAAPAGERLLDAESTITLRREDDDRRPVRVSFVVSGEPGATVSIASPSGPRRVRLGAEPVTVELAVPMERAEQVIALSTDAAPLRSTPRTAPDARLRLSNLTVLDDELAGRREQLELSDS